MIEEYENIQQNKEGVYHKLFFDDYFELNIFYNIDDTEIVRFQLLYNRKDNPHILTWMNDLGFKHTKAYNKDVNASRKKKYMLIPDGIFNNEKLAQKFKEESKNVDPDTAEFILSKILEYDIEDENIFL